MKFGMLSKLPKTGKATSNEWEIISTFVLELNDEIKVLSLATGSKCVPQSSLSSNGDVINDSHAEKENLKLFYILG